MKALVLFYEGAHDQWFLYRILILLKFKHLSPVIKEMIYPLNEYVSNTIRDHPNDELKVEQLRPAVPMLMIRADQNQLVVLYSMDGNTDFRNVKRTINVFSAYQRSVHMDKRKTSKVESFSFMFFTDADEKGVEYQVNRFKSNLSSSLDGLDELQHNLIFRNSTFSIGCYIFSHPNGFGNLEDITLPLFEEGYELMFQEVKEFLRKHGNLNDKLEKKATLGVVGQLENPGASNAVHIQKSILLTEDKLKAHLQSQEIISLLERILND
ncbi:hypothetical protein SAMN04487897_11727 [Paenibacillus sp. yr247]|uniref:DUF3226 domain-containing protein n=1 Tax=Paenibacillus sp. yr247 TaxID=1761880 RepID=UPI000885552A|nr:DUF3226 domain-containing protein [Paenibacillus sp. yr247]SDO57629.1 hypothetical protein SAMN04487897_11727 [Paenibacillus sp. yr247]